MTSYVTDEMVEKAARDAAVDVQNFVHEVVAPYTQFYGHEEAFASRIAPHITDLIAAGRRQGLEEAKKAVALESTDYRCTNGHDRCFGIGDRDCPYCERYSPCVEAIDALLTLPPGEVKL